MKLLFVNIWTST